MLNWDVSPDIFAIGPFVIRWYGLLFALSFMTGFQIMSVIFKKEQRSDTDLNDLVWYMILGTVLGARIGHCMFYNPAYYLNHPLEILQVWKGGLASHGAAIGIIIAILLFVSRRKKFTFLWLMDRIVITVALSGFFIRMGNLFNSEIIGKPTNAEWGFVFTAIDNVPRHPAQLYEAIAYLLIFIFLIVIYLKKYQTLKNGYLFGIFLITVFGFRFFVEFIKENQTYFEEDLTLNMGQILSIPLIIYGIVLLFISNRKTLNQ
ncbi:MAG: prolipoprotein diacylglyceryl transferase [Melioribacteraceae bacterium]|nr:prolipoprotein diacylglyceryl transferase [Melioribacteraceae bacterium]